MFSSVEFGRPRRRGAPSRWGGFVAVIVVSVGAIGVAEAQVGRTVAAADWGDGPSSIEESGPTYGELSEAERSEVESHREALEIGAADKSPRVGSQDPPLAPTAVDARGERGDDLAEVLAVVELKATLETRSLLAGLARESQLARQQVIEAMDAEVRSHASSLEDDINSLAVKWSATFGWVVPRSSLVWKGVRSTSSRGIQMSRGYRSWWTGADPAHRTRAMIRRDRRAS